MMNLNTKNSYLPSEKSINKRIRIRQTNLVKNRIPRPVWTKPQASTWSPRSQNSNTKAYRGRESKRQATSSHPRQAKLAQTFSTIDTRSRLLTRGRMTLRPTTFNSSTRDKLKSIWMTRKWTSTPCSPPSKRASSIQTIRTKQTLIWTSQKIEWMSNSMTPLAFTIQIKPKTRTKILSWLRRKRQSSSINSPFIIWIWSSVNFQIGTTSAN